MHNPRKIVKVSPVLFTSVSQTFDDFCRKKCFTSPCLAKNKQVMATQSKLVCLKLVFVHFSSVIYGFTRLHVVSKIFLVDFGLFCRIYAVKGKEISIYLQI